MRVITMGSLFDGKPPIGMDGKPKDAGKKKKK